MRATETLSFCTSRRIVGRLSLPVAVVTLVLLPAPSAHALTESGEIAGLSYTVYAPEWTWQRRDINILVVLENGGASATPVRVSLELPVGGEDHFGLRGQAIGWDEQPLHFEVMVPPGAVVRQAFTGITALPGFPRTTYEFALALRSGSQEVRVPYRVRTVRGQTLKGGRWSAVLVPVAVALVWCIAFVLALRRFSTGGAWKTSGAPIPEPEAPEHWIEGVPR